MQAELQAFYETRLPGAKITRFASITDGWETEVYTFTLEMNGSEEQRILRVYPGNDAQTKAAHEFEVMQKLHAVGYPVPQVFEHHAAGRPFITMQYIEGQSASSLYTPEKADHLLNQFCRLQVDLHALDIQPFLPAGLTMADVADPLWFAKRVGERLAHLLQSDVGETLRPLVNFLQENVVHSPRLSLLHSDFHGSNILITPAGQPFVIDWGTSLIGDYRFDLAWTLLLSSTYGQPEMYDLILKRYADIRGEPVPEMAYFEVLAVLRRLVDLLVALHSGAEHHGMRPETVNIMRQHRAHYEAVYAWLPERTGLRLPAVERMLATLG